MISILKLFALWCQGRVSTLCLCWPRLPAFLWMWPPGWWCGLETTWRSQSKIRRQLILQNFMWTLNILYQGSHEILEGYSCMLHSHIHKTILIYLDIKLISPDLTYLKFVTHSLIAGVSKIFPWCYYSELSSHRNHRRTTVPYTWTRGCMVQVSSSGSKCPDWPGLRQGLRHQEEFYHQEKYYLDQMIHFDEAVNVMTRMCKLNYPDLFVNW